MRLDRVASVSCVSQLCGKAPAQYCLQLIVSSLPSGDLEATGSIQTAETSDATGQPIVLTTIEPSGILRQLMPLDLRSNVASLSQHKKRIEVAR